MSNTLTTTQDFTRVPGGISLRKVIKAKDVAAIKADDAKEASDAFHEFAHRYPREAMQIVRGWGGGKIARIWKEFCNP